MSQKKKYAATFHFIRLGTFYFETDDEAKKVAQSLLEGGDPDLVNYPYEDSYIEILDVNEVSELPDEDDWKGWRKK